MCEVKVMKRVPETVGTAGKSLSNPRIQKSAKCGLKVHTSASAVSFTPRLNG